MTAANWVTIHRIRHWPGDRVVDFVHGPGTVRGLLRDIGVWVEFDSGDTRLMAPGNVRPMQVPS